MTNTRHRNADVIIAFAEGKTIQNRAVNNVTGDKSDWVDFVESDREFAPNFSSSSWEWRVKPEKVKGWINIYPDNGGEFYIHETKEKADASRMVNIKKKDQRIACIEIEYEPGEGL